MTPLNLIKNKYLDKFEYTSDMRRYKLNNRAKYIFNIAEFLIAVNREDVLERHFDLSYPKDLIEFPEYHYTSGQWLEYSQCRTFRFNRNTQMTNLDQEIRDLIANNQELWDCIKYKKINWTNQKIFEFIQITELEY